MKRVEKWGKRSVNAPLNIHVYVCVMEHLVCALPAHAVLERTPNLSMTRWSCSNVHQYRLCRRRERRAFDRYRLPSES